MPALNKQALVNLLIDSPLREPIKINLIDIINNTKDQDLPKVYPTITKELEIFQKATDRRLKLASETIKKLSTDTPAEPKAPAILKSNEAQISNETKEEAGQVSTEPAKQANSTQPALKTPPLDLPPLPTPTTSEAIPTPTPTPAPAPTTPTPTINPTPPTPEPNPQPIPTDKPALPPLPSAESSESADEDALKEIQKELDALKDSATVDANPPAPTTAQPEV